MENFRPVVPAGIPSDFQQENRTRVHRRAPLGPDVAHSQIPRRNFVESDGRSIIKAPAARVCATLLHNRQPGKIPTIFGISRRERFPDLSGLEAATGSSRREILRRNFGERNLTLVDRARYKAEERQ